MKSQTKQCLMCRNPAFISWHFLSTSWELWKREKGQHQMKGLSHFFFMSSCSCLCLFRTSVFRFEWQENVAGTSARSQRYSTSPRGLSVTASCGIQFTLDGSLFTQGDGVNKEQFNHRIPPLFSFSPCMQNDGIKGNRGEREENHVKQITAKQRNVWYGLGLWRCSVEPNVCVCDKTGVSLLSEWANSRKGWSSGASAPFYPVVSHAARP